MKKIYIKKEVSIKKISPRYKPIIEEVKICLIEFSDKIHSIYLYGSVATGKAQSPTSDLDLLIVLNEKPTRKTKNLLSKIQKEFSSKYSNLFREVGFSITDIDEILKGKNSFGWKFFLEILCIRIYGKDPVKKKIKFLPTKQLAKNLHSDIKKNLKIAKNRINSANGPELNLIIKSIMKKIIRTSFSIVMERDNSWTSDIDKMAKTFVKYYPEKKDEIDQILELTKEDSPEKYEALFVIDNFGKWIILEFNKVVNRE